MIRRIPIFWRIVIALALVTIVAIAITPRDFGQRAARRERFSRESPRVFEDLPLPADATPHAPRSQSTLERRGLRIIVEQAFERPGAFAATDALYQRELPPRGWREYDRSGVDRKYCKAPFILEVENDAGFGEAHRFTLRLIYNDAKGGKWKCRD